MFNELAEKGRSVKVYAARPVEAAKIDAIIEAALRSHTGRAARPWAFVVVTDKNLLEKLSLAKPLGAAFFKDAPVAVGVGERGQSVNLGNFYHCTPPKIKKIQLSWTDPIHT